MDRYPLDPTNLFRSPVTFRQRLQPTSVSIVPEVCGSNSICASPFGTLSQPYPTPVADKRSERRRDANVWIAMVKTGRPREFDRDLAVEQAMHVFWAYGYEAASLTRLREVLGGISPSSFYAAFGSKEALFREALTVYTERYGTCLAPLFDESLPPRSAMEQALRRSVDMQTDDAHPPGCLVCSATVSAGSEADEVHRAIAAIRATNRDAIRGCVDRGARAGELDEDRDVVGLAAAFNGFLLGISAQARDGLDRSTLQCAVSEIMRLWTSRPT